MTTAAGEVAAPAANAPGSEEGPKLKVAERRVCQLVSDGAVGASLLQAIADVKSAGGDLNFLTPWALKTSPLILAAYRGDMGSVRALLDGGADVNLYGERCKTALMVACEQGKGDVALELLDRGADAATRAEDGTTALAYAARGGLVAVANRLISLLPAGSLTEADELGWQPLHRIAASAPEELFIALVRVTPQDAPTRRDPGCWGLSWPVSAALSRGYSGAAVLAAMDRFPGIDLEKLSESTVCKSATAVELARALLAPAGGASSAENSAGDGGDAARLRAAAGRVLPRMLPAPDLNNLHTDFKDLLEDSAVWAGAVGSLSGPAPEAAGVLTLFYIAAQNEWFPWSSEEVKHRADSIGEALSKFAAGHDRWLAAAALSVLLGDDFPSPTDGFPEGWGIPESAERLLINVRRCWQVQTHVSKRAWELCEPFVAASIFNDFGSSFGLCAQVAMGLLRHPGVFHDSTTMVNPESLTEAPQDILEDTPEYLSLLSLLFTADGDCSDVDVLATFLLFDQTCSGVQLVENEGLRSVMVPALARQLIALKPQQLLRHRGALSAAAAAGAAGCLTPAPALAAVIPAAAAAAAAAAWAPPPLEVYITAYSVICLPKPGEASLIWGNTRTALVRAVLDGARLRDLTRQILAGAANSFCPGYAWASDTFRTAAKQLAALLRAGIAQRSDVGGPSGGGDARQPPAKRQRRLSREERQREYQGRQEVTFRVAGEVLPVTLVRVIWSRWLSESSPLRRLFSQPEGGAAAAAAAGGEPASFDLSSLFGGSPLQQPPPAALPEAAAASAASALAAPGPPLLAGVPAGEETKYFLAAVEFVHEYDDTREEALPQGVAPLPLYAMAAYLEIPVLMDACLPRLNLKHNATLTALCDILLGEGPKHDADHEQRAAPLIAARLLEKAAAGRPKKNPPARAVAAVEEAVRVALRGLLPAEAAPPTAVADAVGGAAPAGP